MNVSPGFADRFTGLVGVTIRDPAPDSGQLSDVGNLAEIIEAPCPSCGGRMREAMRDSDRQWPEATYER